MIPFVLQKGVTIPANMITLKPKNVAILFQTQPDFVGKDMVFWDQIHNYRALYPVIQQEDMSKETGA